MNYVEWQEKRRELMEREKQERTANWQQSRPPIQASVNEQAIRELYGLTATLRERLEVVEAKRGPGRPPNPKPEGE